MSMLIKKAANLSMLAIVFLYGFAILPVYAATDSDIFIVQSLVDQQPPTAPASLTATMISESRIDLAWPASTDDVGVVEYQIYRDTNPLTIVTGLSYSDTSVAASTTYAYNVSALDSVGNESGLSPTATTTTSQDYGGGGGGGGGTLPTPPSIDYITVTEGYATATISFATDPATQSVVSWGETVAYEKGSTTTEEFLTSHTLYINGLDSGTTYYFSISATDGEGDSASIDAQTFSTLADLPVISDVSVNVGTTTATTTWITNVPTGYTFYYGTTTGYEIGAIAGGSMDISHELVLTSLDPETIYYYMIEATDSLSRTDQYAGSFETVQGADSTPPLNVSNLSATSTAAQEVSLSWVNPPDSDFAGVRIVRSDLFVPSDPYDGLVVYNGVAESMLDTTIVLDTLYFYTAFAYDTNSNFSSGAVVAISIPSPSDVGGGDDGDGGDGGEDSSGDGGDGSEDPPGDDGDSDTTSIGTTTVDIDPVATSTDDREPDLVDLPDIPEPTDNNDDPLDRPSDIFESIPTVDTVPEVVKQADYFLRQGDADKPFFNKGTVDLSLGDPITVSVAYEKVPEVLKSIIAVFIHEDTGEESTYLLRINEDKSAYEAQISSLLRKGPYQLRIYLFDFKHQRLERISGRITTTGDIPEVKSTTLVPVSSVFGFIGIGVGVTQVVIIATGAMSFGELWLLILRLFTLMGSPFRKRNKKPWGVVYDSETKRPLDPAYVTITRPDGQAVSEAITDLDGRFGFLVPSGSYVVEANKTHYQFPSRKLQGKKADVMYDNLYFGNEVGISDSGVIDFNIPLDPVEFDWNEYAKQQMQVFQVHSRNERIRSLFFNTLFYAGLVFSVFAAYVTPSTLNFVIVCFYVGVIGFQFVWSRKHKVTRVVDSLKGVPVPNAIIKAHLAGNGVMTKKVVADGFGKFYMLVPPGAYFFTVEARQEDGEYKEVFRTGTIQLDQGVLLEDLDIATVQVGDDH